MDIFKITAVAVVGMILAITVKNIRPEIAVLVSLATGIYIFFFCIDGLGGVFSSLYEIINKAEVDTRFIKISIKACVIAYITQFSSELCRDAGEGAIALKLELAGKISILLISMPVISAFLEAIGNLLDGI